MQQVLNIHNHIALLSHLLNSGFYPSLNYGPYRKLYITNATKPWQSSGKEEDNLVAWSIRMWCTTLHICLSILRWQSIFFNTSWKNLMHNSSFYIHFIEKTRRHLQIGTGTDYSGYVTFQKLLCLSKRQGQFSYRCMNMNIHEHEHEHTWARTHLQNHSSIFYCFPAFLDQTEKEK